ncbi:myosin head [Dictyocaulus viviparus]|uniref:Myosin head n=1 Tax=Dictyocaulus viviparus TaxID=29172 RepID=A0A0D8XKN7_DICVI|nr:myosin head [Dictyocaulus viviparus]
MEESDLRFLQVQRAAVADPARASEWAGKKLCWVPHEKDGFVAGSIKQETNDEVIVEICDSGKTVTISKDDVQKANPPKFDKVEDMSELTYLNEASVLHNLKERYFSSLIYTYSGLFCVVINPYKRLPIYSESLIEEFKGKKRHEMPPHIFAIADSAYRSMLQDREDQSILCTGESGAGKTENTKKVIQYLAHVAGATRSKGSQSTVSPAKGELEQQLLQANPILEAFGNSKTVKNDNSSRFGKFIRINFDMSGYISGANIEFYLLEKSRTLRQAPEERSFHIFYQFLRGTGVAEKGGCIYKQKVTLHRRAKESSRLRIADSAMSEIKTVSRSRMKGSGAVWSIKISPYQVYKETDIDGRSAATAAAYLLEDIDKYRFLVNGNITLPNVDDSQEFQSTLKSMRIMGFAEDEITSVLRVVSATILMGNLEFTQEKKSDQAILPNDKVIQKVCHLLGLPVIELTKAFLRPRIKVGREFVNKAQNKEQAEFAVEAIAKASYERMFKWLVNRINKSLDRTRRQGASFIGILDIAGFEIFELNSFEQLCINFTNEKLQQLFNNTMFIMEQEEYQREGIEWQFIDFGLDLQPTIDLIEKPMGLLALLDEQCLFPKATDKTLVEKLQKTHSKHPKFIVPDMRAKSDFAVVHYAGRVDYSADQWLMKNMDPLNENVVALMQSSTDSFVCSIWKDGKLLCLYHKIANISEDFQAEFAGICAAEMNETAFGVRAKKGMFRTVSQLHKEQLTRLMTTLRNTSPHFVRCIIPNHEKKAGKINSMLVLEQLRCNGVLEGIRICRQGFPNRVPFQEFRHRYEILTPNVIPRGFMDGKEAVKKMIEFLEVDANLYRIGQSKVFFRTGVLAHLEEERDLKLTDLIVQFQAQCRAFLARRLYAKRVQQFNAIRLIQRNGLAWMKLRNWQWWRLFTKVKPLLQVTNQEAAIAAKEDEIRAIREKLENVEAEYRESLGKVDQVIAERNVLQDQLQQEADNNAELEEVKNRLQLKKNELEDMVNEMRDRLVEEEQRTEKMVHEKKKLVETVRDLEEQLEQEEQARQKLQLDKANVDQRVKNVETKLVDLTDSHDKLLKEKRMLEDKMNQLNLQLTEEEERVKQVARQRGKFEGHVQELEQELLRERQLKNEVEQHKRKLITELEDSRELLEEKRNKLEELNGQLMKREEELSLVLTRSDEEAATIALLQKQIRDMQATIDELREDIETERVARNKAEMARREVVAQLEKVKGDMLDKVDETSVLQDIMRRKEDEVRDLKKAIESTSQALENKLEEQKHKYNRQIEDLHEKFEQQKKINSQQEKYRHQVENERAEMSQELITLQAQKAEADKRRKQQESQLMDVQSQLAECNEYRLQALEQLEKTREELDEITRSREDEEQIVSNLNRKIATLEEQLHEISDQVQEETRAKLAQINRVRQLEEEMATILEERDELDATRQHMERDLIQLRTQLSEARKKADEGIIQHMEELRKKAQRDLENCQHLLDESEAAKERLVQSKKKLQQELEDANIELENIRTASREMEKRQKKFDMQLAEERANVQKVILERDAHAQESRDRETRILSLVNELEHLKGTIDETERVRRMLQLELDESISSKDDVGKNVHELEKAKRQLEQTVQEQKVMIEELEDQLGFSEDARLRLEVNMQALRAEQERNLTTKDLEAEDKRRSLVKQLRDIEQELENERRSKTGAISQKKKMEAHIAEIEQQLDVSNRLKDEYNKQLKKNQQMIKEYQHDSEEARQMKEEIASQLRDIERRLRSAEAENQRLAEANEMLISQKRQLELEKDELEEYRGRGGVMSSEDKRRLEQKLAQLEEELEEEQNNAEIAIDKQRKAQQQLEQITTELSMERSVAQKSEAERQGLERQNRELKAKLAELESTAQSRARAQIAALEAKIQYLEEQNSAESQERHNATRQFRRIEKRLHDTILQLEDERRNVEQQKEIAEKCNLRAKQMRRQLDEQEEEMTRERAKSRNLQREIDDLTEANDTLTRENSNLRGGVARRNRENIRLRSTYQIPGSSDNLTRNDDEDGSIGTEGDFVS